MARRKRREGQKLERVLGVPALFSTAYGNVGSSIYYALGVVAAAALGLTPLVFVITGLLFMTTAWSYAEATAAMPEAGGSASFARRAFNEFVSFAIGWGQMLVYTATIAISALFVPHYLAVFWPVLKAWPYNTIGGAATILLLVGINVVGIKEAARLNVILAALDLVTQILIMLISLVLLFDAKVLLSQIHWGVAPTGQHFLYGIAIGTVAYTGIETVSNMAEEAAQPGRDVPRAINLVILVVLIVYIGMPLAALSVMRVGANQVPVNPATGLTIPIEAVPGHPEGTWVLKSDPHQPVYVPLKVLSATRAIIPAQKPEGAVRTVNGQQVTTLYGTQLGSDYVEDPVQGMVRFLPKDVSWLRALLGPWVGILAATILLIATNAGIIGVSRLAYSLGQHRQLPPLLSRVHPQRLTPYVAIIAFGMVAIVLILPGQVRLLADLYAFGSMISFTAAHASVVVLRFKEPDLERPFRAPLNVRLRGRAVPLTALVGALGTFSVWLVIVWFQSASRVIGFAWMAVGLVVYVLYRRAKGLSLTKTVTAARLPAFVQEDIVYDQLLVPIVGSQVTDEMVVLACQLATEKNSAIDALYVIEVPMNLPLDARLAAERERAKQVLDRAMTIAEQFGVMMTPIVLTARQAGRAIVQQAVERRSEVIVLGAESKRRMGDRVFGRTIDYVLQHLPCEVIINIVPRGYGARSETVHVPPGATLEAASLAAGSHAGAWRETDQAAPQGSVEGAPTGSSETASGA
jgi:APA family basic amino acid/polyamine antiporter